MASKNFVLQVRPLEVGDLRLGTPFIPEQSEYSMYLDALREELSFNQIVAAVVRTESTFKICTFISISAEEIRALFKPIFGGDLFSKLRLVSFMEA
jgi:hypothetical protein